MAIMKLKTGISGLDQVFKGGIRENSSVLISGGPGTGKTIFAMQFLVEGAKTGQPGLCILYGSEKEGFLEYADSIGVEVRKYVKSGAIFILEQPFLTRKFMSIAAALELIHTKKIKRVVIDSLTMFAYVHVQTERDYRKEIVNFLSNMTKVTLVATAEGSESNIDGDELKPEYFLFDGILFLNRVRRAASFERVLFIGKMRGQDHLMEIFPFLIGEGGIRVYPDQLPFSLMGMEAKKRLS